jgi:hypothetical protein
MSAKLDRRVVRLEAANRASRPVDLGSIDLINGPLPQGPWLERLIIDSYGHIPEGERPHEPR